MPDLEPKFNPFPGLRSFEADEDHLFFGRERRIDELLARLRRTRFLAVVGTSGSGKSSLVRSGLIPSLYSGFMTQAGSSWRVAVFRPGDDPIGNLADALNEPDVLGMEGELAETNRSLLEATLRRSTLGLVECVKGARVPREQNLLVLVDQFEELFRFKRNTLIKDSGDDAVAFVKLLLEASAQEEAPIYIVITMRSDFIGNFTEFQGLAEAVNDGQYLVPRMTREERRSAIVGPVAVGGGEISPRLVLTILNDVGDDPDQLPTMQHALMRTWDYWAEHRADGEPMDLRHYEAIGTIKGALSQHAEEAFNELVDAPSKEAAELMFKALTDRASDNRGVRAPKRLHEICTLAAADEARVKAVVEAFRAPGRSFLMPPADRPLHSDSIIDISHESLMRIWTRLIGWVDEESRSVQVYLRIAKAARQYQEGKAALFRDPELQLALNWVEEARPTAAWAERYDVAFERAMLFLEHSKRQRDQEIAEKERQRRRQLQWARRLAVILGSAAIVTLLFGLYAMTLKIEAEENWQEAVRQKEIADQQRAEAERQREIAEEEKVRAEQARTVAEEQREIAEDERQRAEEERLRAETQEQEAQRQRSQAVAARELEAEARGEAESQRTIAVEQKERADTLRVQAEISEAEAQRLRMLSVARELATQTLRLAQEGQQELAALLARQAFHLHERNGGDPADPVLFDALRTTLARLAPDQVQVLRHHQDAVRSLAVLTGTGKVASGSDDGTVRLFDPSVPDGAPTVLGSAGTEVRSVAWSEVGRRLAVASLDGSIRIWQVPAEGTEPLLLIGHSAGVTALAFRADGSLLASGDLAGEVRLWPTGQPGAGIIVQGGGGDRVRSLVFTADGSLVVASAERGVQVFNADAPAQAPREILSGHQVHSLAASRLGHLAAGTDSGTILILAPGLDGQPSELAGHSSPVTSLAFDATGERLASASLDGSVRLWRALQPEHAPIKITGHSGWVWAVVFSADGELLVSGGADRTVRTWSTRSEPLADAICRHATRNLTDHEWGDFLPADIPWEATCTGL